MAINSVSNQPQSQLYRPTQLSSLQSNLAQYYERTSDFVYENFEDLVKEDDILSSPRTQEKPAAQEAKARLNPKGLGSKIDMLV